MILSSLYRRVFQVSQTGPVTGGVGADATAPPSSPTVTPTGSSGSASSAGHLIVNSFRGIVALATAAILSS